MHLMGTFLVITIVYVFVKTCTVSYDNTACAKNLVERYYQVKDKFYKLSNKIDDIVDKSKDSKELEAMLDKFNQVENVVDKLDDSELDLFQIELMDKLSQQLNRIR